MSPNYSRDPPFPYVRSRCFTVHEHTPPYPPPPIPTKLTQREKTERIRLSLLQRSILHPPQGGSLGTSTVEFEISYALQAGEEHRSQVLAVNILKTSSDCLKKNVTRAVAKVYDPLYYDHTNCRDPFSATDLSYATEAAVYNRLADLQGTVIPAYYGSYSLELPVDQSTTRTVRLILMEFIQGYSMQELEPAKFLQSERKRIMKLVIDGESAIYTRDICLMDKHPRNVMVVQSCDASQSVSRIVHIDFEKSSLSRMWKAPICSYAAPNFLPGTFISPLLRWHESWDVQKNFQAWIDWDYQSWLEEEYAHTKSSITPEMRDVFLPAEDSDAST
ncbi:hypothetical protein PRK78_007040 [Emydomyces testavorans]|uniref:Protein kinase domain-containing protein n=1 Tax=Emydomyces testavorans TaxID=2070801 RepID=A0AAF0DRB8_9EURO|nr:hypothetical protein PRK78_007040 [Emydomyces testavorans]